MAVFWDNKMSLISRLFGSNTDEIKRNILSTKESIRQLEILTEKLDITEQQIISHSIIMKNVNDNIDIAIWAKDIDNRFVYANKLCCDKILHCSEEEAINFTDTDFENATLAIACNTSDNIVKDQNICMRFLEYDGVGNFWDTLKTPWIIDGVVGGTIGTAKDITNIVPSRLRQTFSESGIIEINIDDILCPDLIKKILS